MDINLEALEDDQKTKISIATTPPRFPKNVNPKLDLTLDHTTYGIESDLTFNYKGKGAQGFVKWGML